MEGDEAARNTFATAAEALTPEALTGYLRASGHLSEGAVTGLASTLIGTGKMGDNARLELSFTGDRGTAPETLVAKFPAADEQARSMAGAQGAYYAEVMFYRELAGRTTMHTPRIYGSELSEDRTEFLLLMQDMQPAQPGSQLIGESREHAALALREAARLAGAFYGESFVDCDHVTTAAADDGGAFAEALMQQCWPGFLERFGHGISAECIAFGDRFVQHVAHFISRFDGPKTLVHGDFRSENILFGDGEATTVDWQTPSQSSAVADAAYFLGGSVDIADRRDWEQQLMRDYADELARLGVGLGFDEVWQQYREFSMHGLIITVLGCSFSAPDPRGDQMFLAMIQRHLQHCLDLQADEFLPA